MRHLKSVRHGRTRPGAMPRSSLPGFQSLRLPGLLGLLMSVPGMLYADTFYNITQYQVDKSERESFPLQLKPDPLPQGFSYQGTLDVNWYAKLDAPPSSLVLSNENARLRTPLLTMNTLVTSPDNCWGMDMGFGLIELSAPSRLDVTVAAADGSPLIPAFALYEGWDTSKNASRHSAITFGPCTN